MSTIPAKAIASVIPGVLSAGGTALDVIEMMLTDSTLVPINVVQSFSNAIDVANYFGPSSAEFSLAEIYFEGFDNSFIKPGKLKFVQYPQSPVQAYLRGGSLAGITVAEINAFPVAAIALMIDGATITAASVDLTAATSPSDAATKIEAAFTATQATATSNTISGTTMTLGGTITGTWAPGQTVAGVGVTAGSYIVALLTGTPNTDGATYQLSESSTVGSGEAMTGGVVPAVTFDSVTNAFTFKTVLAGSTETIGFAATNGLTTDLHLTSATGAVTSQGAGAATPNAFMTNLIQIDQDWATFMTTFDPDESGNDNKYAFALWNGQQTNRYAYVCWDTDLSPSTEVPASASLGQRIKAAQISGTFLWGGDGTNAVTAAYAAFGGSYGACLDFDRLNGRFTMAFRQQSGLLATCSNQSAGDNLIANGYSFYGAYATANEQFIWTYNGEISGPFLWFDSYINQIWMNNQFQLAIMVLFQQAPTIPYNSFGYSLIEAACLDVINAAVNFGAIRAGVTLSMSQIAAVNAASGLNIAPIINQRGWYFQVQDASPDVRAARGSPPCTFWYTDGQSVQQINLFSEELV